MALNEDFKDFVLDQIGGVGPFDTKRMFGGVALLRDGSAFAKIKHDKVWLKANDNNKQDFMDLGMKQYTYGKNNSRTLNFFEVPAKVIENRDQLQAWAKKSIEATLTK